MGVEWYNQIAIRNGGYKSNAVFTTEGISAEQIFEKRLIEMLPQYQSILDAGCGDGYWLEILRNLGFNNLFGVDISHSFLKRAKKKGFNVAQYDISNMSFLREFDIVIMCDVLEHLSDIDSALDCVRKALKNAGIFYLMIPVYDSLSSKFNRLIHGKKKIDEAKEHDETHLHAFSKHSLISLLQSHRFNVIKNIYTANRLPFITGKIQQITFGNRFGNWLSIISRKENN